MTQQNLPARRKGRLLWLLLAILLIVIVILAAAGWWGWQQWQHLEGDRANLGKQISSLQQDLTDQRQQSSKQQQALQTLRSQQNRMEARQARANKVLADVQKGGQRFWLINEAESLASLASQRLILTGNAAAARQLLKAADKTLGEIHDPDVLPARRALAADMETLNGAMQVDVQGMVLRLAALQDVVPKLAVPARAHAPQNAGSEEDQNAWQRFLGYLPIEIHRHEGKVPLPLTDSQATLVRLTLESSLQQAQLALMQSRYKAYQQALDSARQTVHEWFRDDSPQARQMLAALHDLGGPDVKQAMPEIGAGLAAIRQLKRKTIKAGDDNKAGNGDKGAQQ